MSIEGIDVCQQSAHDGWHARAHVFGRQARKVAEKVIFKYLKGKEMFLFLHFKALKLKVGKEIRELKLYVMAW